MKPGTKWALVSIGVAAAGISSYLLLRKSKMALRNDINALLTPSDVAILTPALNQMSRQELADVYALLRAEKNGVKQLTDPELRKRLTIISHKFNIFT